ncbi:hypothetical protein STRDD11_00981 [Streptococcus sp. DD11]|nr:hypothetical protein STRDD11_00981 [Streptococcus sp. DD11]
MRKQISQDFVYNLKLLILIWLVVFSVFLYGIFQKIHPSVGEDTAIMGVCPTLSISLPSLIATFTESEISLMSTGSAFVHLPCQK